jgi:hypothetical protein
MARALITFEIYPDEGDMFLLDATSRDVARWEKQGKGRSMAKFQSNPTMEDLELVAFIALMREVESGRRTFPAGAEDIAGFRATCDVTPQKDKDDDDDDQEERGLDPTLRVR